MKISQYKSNKPDYQTVGSITRPPSHTIAVFEWETFEPISDFSNEQLFSVFERISRDIIERPYHYAYHKIFDSDGNQLPRPDFFKVANNDEPPAKVPNGVVYKQNHGTGHALRQMIYVDRLVASIAHHGNVTGKKFAKQVINNPEIDKALKLAAFCKRIGRTMDNEDDLHQSDVPTIYSKRSADIFALIARELGFDGELVELLQQSMLEPMPINYSNNCITSKYAFLNNDFRKFCTNTLMASHKADLARIFFVDKRLIKNELQSYFDFGTVDSVVKSLIEHACQLNSLTGNPVVRQERGIRYQESPLNGRKLVHVVNNLNIVMPVLVSEYAALVYGGSNATMNKQPSHSKNLDKVMTLPQTESSLKYRFQSLRSLRMHQESFAFFRRTGLTNQKIDDMSFVEIIEYAQNGSRWYSANRTAQILITMGVLDKARNIMPDYEYIFEAEHGRSISVI